MTNKNYTEITDSATGLVRGCAVEDMSARLQAPYPYKLTIDGQTVGNGLTPGEVIELAADHGCCVAGNLW